MSAAGPLLKAGGQQGGVLGPSLSEQAKDRACALLPLLRAHHLPDGGHLPEQHISHYALAGALLEICKEMTTRAIRDAGYANAQAFYQGVIAVVQEEGLPLPTSYSRLRGKVREYEEHGVAAIVNGRFGNSNAQKIDEQVRAWLVSQYAQPTKPDCAKVTMLYAQAARANDWPLLTESAIYKFLHRADVQQVWYMGRHGKDAWKNRFEHAMRLRGPVFRDAMWTSDGTKLNYFYQDSNGMAALLKVYMVIDVFSEAILGWHVSTTEDFRAQYAAMKMALLTSGHKPLQLLYDGQSGHKKRESQEFFDRATRLHFKAKPYNGQSKPIESLFGRIQKKVMRDRWFFTGQNIGSRRMDSKPNMEFILANKDRLPSLQEVLEFTREDVATWNDGLHHSTGVARMEMYRESTNPQAIPVDFLDMVELFWHRTARPVTYRRDGLRLELGNTRHLFEVYDADGQVDLNFLRQWTNARFTVFYDPEDLSHVRLYRIDDNADLRFIAAAQAKKAYARAAVDLRPGERGEIDKNLQLRKDQADRVRRELDDLRGSSGVDPETLVAIGHLGDKDDLNAAENDLMVPAVPAMPVLITREPTDSDDDDIDPLGML